MNLLVIDDDKNFLEYIKQKILIYSFQKNIDLNIETFSTIPQDIPTDVDAFFLDIEIGEKNIYPYMDKIRASNMNIPIVILSNYDFYIIKSVKYNIFDFIRKRKLDKELYDTLDRMIPYINKTSPSIYTKINGTYIRIRLADIVYIKVSSHNSELFTIYKYFDIDKDIKKILGNEYNYFTRVHRSYFINMLYLQKIQNNTITLTNEVVIPVGKTYKENLLKEYINRNL